MLTLLPSGYASVLRANMVAQAGWVVKHADPIRGSVARWTRTLKSRRGHGRLALVERTVDWASRSRDRQHEYPIPVLIGDEHRAAFANRDSLWLLYAAKGKSCLSVGSCGNHHGSLPVDLLGDIHGA